MDTMIKQEIQDIEEVEIAEQSSNAGLQHYLTRRAHPLKGTSKKLFPAHASMSFITTTSVLFLE